MGATELVAKLLEQWTFRASSNKGTVGEGDGALVSPCPYLSGSAVIFRRSRQLAVGPSMLNVAFSVRATGQPLTRALQPDWGSQPAVPASTPAFVSSSQVLSVHTWHPLCSTGIKEPGSPGFELQEDPGLLSGSLLSGDPCV